ncbi:phosphoglycerate dehydrogenase [Cupriavidus plantarum]|uniref:D-3-phosphoglycerate dehydrogenase n=1 Tax=Cupriavidus plantarum TaxID=942865 RepID=A0A316EPP0_9BURK|nr:phosphoglycerate dehydrogenase [Cupriavidus plantarum]PWK34045.1 D-3-phosphoglycerate dehydrogenase [Cupriavidus plantarum]CAG2147245.1 D-3-phosphoglycerate dehydrogenase [Cupriavidus plantarum]SMR85610.1 D-3-phosphoglycerate dehydrogenase [Cupriavidus plantarum]
MTSALLLENIHASAQQALAQAQLTVATQPKALAGDALVEAVQRHELLGIRSATHLTADTFAHARHLLSVGCFCIGTSQVDLPAAAHAGIPVFNAPFSNTRSVAELVIGQTIMLMRRIPEKSRAAHRGQWQKTAKGSFEIRGKTLAVIGYGNIGAQVGILAEAMGMRVVFHDIRPRLSLGSAVPAPSLADALAQADVVTLHVPATPQTRLLIDRAAIASMRRGSILINASRGSVVDIEALAGALDEGHIGGAAIDVFPEEPRSNADAFVSPLQDKPNVILTPHVGGSTEEAQENIGVEVATKLIGFLQTGATVGAVNLPQIQPAPLQAPARILNIHYNRPGALSHFNQAVADIGANIVAQQLQTEGDIGYAITDINVVPPTGWVQSLMEDPTVIRTRMIVA